jgi:hypothetical protein
MSDRGPGALGPWGWGVFSSFQVEPEFTSLLLSGQPSPRASNPPLLLRERRIGPAAYSMELSLGDNSLDK